MLDAAAIAPERIRGITRVEYDRLVEQGWFDDERVELLYGVLVTMSPQGPPHAHVNWRLQDILSRALVDKAIVRGQMPLAISDDSEPEPDVAVVPVGDYFQAHPTNALLVVEVADTSLRKDKGTKAALYAENGVPEYWIVNLVEQVIEVYTGPTDEGYASVSQRKSGDAITLVEFPDIRIAVSDIL